MPTSPNDPTFAGSPLPPAAAPSSVRIPLQRYSPVNVALIVGSVALTIWTQFGQDMARLLPWIISLVPANQANRLTEVQHGQVWRLFTPAFLHFSITHLGFNMLNLVTLGNLLERRIRSPHYLLVTGSIILASDLGQYFISSNPFFGGMSGVVYGLLGYIWLRGRNDVTFGLAIPQQFIILALVWYVLCFTTVFGPIANGAHTVGLVLGALWGVMDGRSAMRQLRAGTFPSNEPPAVGWF